MELSLENRLEPAFDYLEGQYRALMAVAFDLLGIKKNYEIDVSLVGLDDIQTLNRDYRGIDKVTDVISFAFNDDKENIIESNEIPLLLGEIFICVPRAIEQAKEIGNTNERELLFLFCHGLLHLLGYDHMKKEDEEIMFPLQEKILSTYMEERKK